MVEEDERSDAPPLDLRQEAADRESVAEIARLTPDDEHADRS
jgi:hypothetical protein